MRKRAIVGIMLLAAAVAGAGRSGAATPERPAVATTGAASVPLDPFARDLLSRLNSADPAQREAAKKELADIAKVWQQADLLRQMAEVTGDKDMQGLIDQRLNELKAKQALADVMHLPPISLNVTGANLAQLATALNEALNPEVKLTATRSAAGNWTLEAKDKPFWEVFVALTQQRPLSFNGSAGQIILMPNGTAIRRYALDGPAIAYVSSINYSRNMALQRPHGEEEASPASLTVIVTVAVDPRVRVNRIQDLALIAGTDDAGNTLVRPGQGGGGSIGTTSNEIGQSYSLTVPDNPGKTMTLVCEGRLVVQATEATTTIHDVQNSLDKPVTLGGRTFRVTRLDAAGGGPLQMQITATINQPRPTAGTLTENVRYSLKDGGGRSVWSGAGAGSISVVGGNGAAGPYDLEIHVPDKTVEIPVHFELKDVPLP